MFSLIVYLCFWSLICILKCIEMRFYKQIVLSSSYVVYGEVLKGSKGSEGRQEEILTSLPTLDVVTPLVLCVARLFFSTLRCNKLKFLQTAPLNKRGGGSQRGYSAGPGNERGLIKSAGKNGA